MTKLTLMIQVTMCLNLLTWTSFLLIQSMNLSEHLFINLSSLSIYHLSLLKNIDIKIIKYFKVYIYTTCITVLHRINC